MRKLLPLVASILFLVVQIMTVSKSNASPTLCLSK